MMQVCRVSAAVFAILCSLTNPSGAAEVSDVPKPFVIAPTCSAEQSASAVSLLSEAERIVGCFSLAKWSFKGVAVAAVPAEFDGRTVSPEEFRQLRKKIFREQSVRLRAERDMSESMPGEPPTHASTPMSLFVRVRTPLGVFLNENNYIGFADLVPMHTAVRPPGQQNLYPMIQLETWVLVKGQVVKLVQMSPISGMTTVGEGFVMADDWARRLNGGERLASED
jgi:hypothetical protein